MFSVPMRGEQTTNATATDVQHGAGRRQARVERLNLGSVSLWELKASAEIDTSFTRQKYITNHAVDEPQAYTTLHKMRLGYRAAMSNTI